MSVSENSRFDGHTRVSGVDTTSDPADTSSDFLVAAVNRSFRFGVNKTRPPIRSLNLKFEDEITENAFKNGAVSACFGYKKWRSGSASHIVIACHDRIIKGRMYGSTISMSTLHVGLDPRYMLGWFEQAQDRLYFQDGENRPVGWDGVRDAYVLQENEQDGMPVGTVMSYIQGRLVVFTTDNYGIVSDYVYGNGLKDTRGVESFIEKNQFDDLGAIGTPAALGAITGAIPIPRSGTRNAQGELLVMCENGAFTLNLQGERSTWLFGDIQQIALIGRGAASHTSIVPANADVWYQSTDGNISSFKYERSEREKVWGDTALSREVSKYLKFTDKSHLKYVSAARVHNRLLTTCAITTSPCDIGGVHRFGQGMVALDFDKGSTVNQRTGFAWDGLWTGINPIQLVNLQVDNAVRHLAVSHDDDGQNRIYEFLDDGYDDELDGSRRRIFSFYETPYLFERVQENEQPISKTLEGVALDISDINRDTNVSIKYRSNYYLPWFDLMTGLQLGLPPEKEIPFSVVPNYGDYYAFVQSPTPDMKQCEQASFRIGAKAHHFQVRVEMEGSATINNLRAQCRVTMDTQSSSCASTKDGIVATGVIPLEGSNDFSYKIATKD